MTDANHAGVNVKRLISRRLRRAALLATCAFACLGSVADVHAQASNAMKEVCTVRANNAKLIAQDRDKGVSQQDELRKAQAVAAAMPVQRQLYAQAELTVFVDRLYGRYAKMPPQEAYEKYLAFCEQQAANGAAQVR